MTNIGFEKIEQYKDIAALNGYKKVKNSGGDINAYMKELKFSSRDNGRTPMQWDSGKHAGFSTGTPWLPANPNYAEINVMAEEKNQSSVLNHFKKMTALRKENPVLVYGTYHLLQPSHPEIYAYTRELNGQKMLVLLNFSKKNSIIELKELSPGPSIMINNYDALEVSIPSVTLKPYQAVIILLKDK
jgi:oligo-1,6-glucosidase